jgi:transposase
MVFEDFYGLKISTATLKKFSKNLSDSLLSFDNMILEEVKIAPVKHLDETGFRVTEKTNWLHVISTNKFTHYHLSPKRKALLEGVKGTIVHDHWKPYYQMPNVNHALCNAHHLRELQALIDYEKETWARNMKRFLLFLLLYNFSPTDITIKKLARIRNIYDGILDDGLEHHIQRRKNLPFSGRLTRKKYPGHNLILRLKHYREDVLRFLCDPLVPFTNNQAEQDLRMMKVKQKISGGFRTEHGAQTFIRIRGFLSTARKQNWNIFSVLSDAVNGIMPTLA